MNLGLISCMVKLLVSLHTNFRYQSNVSSNANQKNLPWEKDVCEAKPFLFIQRKSMKAWNFNSISPYVPKTCLMKYENNFTSIFTTYVSLRYCKTPVRAMKHIVQTLQHQREYLVLNFKFPEVKFVTRNSKTIQIFILN
jgi:hypothetical protein